MKRLSNHKKGRPPPVIMSAHGSEDIKMVVYIVSHGSEDIKTVVYIVSHGSEGI